jgi:NADPH:quinone reductase-like Zn-dependent oxidoreductase
LECAGTITAIGSRVTGWSPGDQVCALLDGGGYADEVAVPATQVMPIPASLTVIEAAAIPEVACTVYSNLAMIAGLTAGQTVLVHGAGGGIGTFAIQWASAIGARVITTAGSDVKVQHGLQLGAVVGINYRNQDFVAATMEATDHRGVDAILDVVGSDYLARNVECLAPDGHLVIIGGSMAPTPLASLGEGGVHDQTKSALWGEVAGRNVGSGSFGSPTLRPATLRGPQPVSSERRLGWREPGT